MRVLFAGTGSMGLPMARNLSRAGFEVVAWNRTPSHAEPLRADGVEIAPDLRDAALRCDVAISMLSDDAAVESVMSDALLDSLPDGSTHVSMSTIGVQSARRFAREHLGRGQRFIAAPVFGRPVAAEAAKLWIVTAGEREAIDRCRPLFDAMGQGTVVVGSEPEQACAMKLAGNSILASAIESMAEAYALAEGYGVARETAHEIVSNLFRSPIYDGYGSMVARRHYEPGFRLRLGLKDVRLALEAAGMAGSSMPQLEIVRSQLEKSMHRGDGDLDWSALAELAIAPRSRPEAE